MASNERGEIEYLDNDIPIQKWYIRYAQQAGDYFYHPERVGKKSIKLLVFSTGYILVLFWCTWFGPWWLHYRIAAMLIYFTILFFVVLLCVGGRIIVGKLSSWPQSPQQATSRQDVLAVVICFSFLVLAIGALLCERIE